MNLLIIESRTIQQFHNGTYFITLPKIWFKSRELLENTPTGKFVIIAGDIIVLVPSDKFIKDPEYYKKLALPRE